MSFKMSSRHSSPPKADGKLTDECNKFAIEVKNQRIIKARHDSARFSDKIRMKVSVVPSNASERSANRSEPYAPAMGTL